MRRCAPLVYGAPGLHGVKGTLFSRRAYASRRAFTLLEMCTVLLIIMILLGTTMPSIQSAFVEQAVRNDSRQLALMVRTAMLQSGEQHRAYVIDLTSTTMDLHPVAGPPKDADSSAPTNDQDPSAQNTGPEVVEIASDLDRSNKLVVPDPKKIDGWIAMPKTSWLFKPGDLCPATRVRLVRGQSWLELNFNALTGNVENEATYFP